MERGRRLKEIHVHFATVNHHALFEESVYFLMTHGVDVLVESKVFGDC
jgi:hypothetical protein